MAKLPAPQVHPAAYASDHLHDPEHHFDFLGFGFAFCDLGFLVFTALVALYPYPLGISGLL
jgi:hypothetical protein